MHLQFRHSGLSNLSCVALLLLCLFQHTAKATHIEVFSDPNCQNKTYDWNGPNGYPNGSCTSLKREGNFTSFMVVEPDPGCAITIYGKDKTQDTCSGNQKIGTISTCYNATWYYYSIDECFSPGHSSFGVSSTSTTSSSSTSTKSVPTTLHTHTLASSSATATPVKHDSGPNVGAIVGGTIGGVAAGAIAAAIGIIAFIRYRRTKRAKLDGRNRSGPSPPPYGHGLVEIAAKEAPLRSPGPWGSHPATPAHELDHQQAVELQSNLVHELPDSGRGELGSKSPTGTEGSIGPILGRDRKG